MLFKFRPLLLTTIIILLSIETTMAKIEVSQTNNYSEQRENMLITIKEMDAVTKINFPLAKICPKVLAVMAKIPRHKYALIKDRDYAYANMALSIGYQQTISQPYIVALMTSLLELNNTSRVLEIGTGSGYQTAILAELAKEVFTSEVIVPLAKKAQDILLEQGYNNIHYSYQNGKIAWELYAPFDAIIVTAAANDKLLQKLLVQLSIKGKLVMPIERKNGDQYLYLITKKHYGAVYKQLILPVRFVPMV